MRQSHRFLSAGAMAVIGDWVRGGMKEEVSDLARFIDRMTRLSSRSLVTDWK